MELKDLEDAVENMILQHDYPGYEARSLRIALPAAFNNVSATIYRQALSSKSVFVRLAALRWLQTKSGLAKKYALSITPLFADADPWVRSESIKTLDLGRVSEEAVLTKLLPTLKDTDPMVRKEAAKALGNLAKGIKGPALTGKNKATNEANIQKDSVHAQVITALHEATEDDVLDVRRKAIKSLRKLGAFST